ncbi:MAG: glycoside hydrolase family 65 protein [Oscillospiraceae bacterium]|jgi:kojibiose phosphorylase|nr:glycoside hydrolase family 65 protein [Oscillospiraceae bacterium]
MRDDVKLHKWGISAESRVSSDDFLESIFFTGNGRMGARGYLALDPSVSPVKSGLFLAGIFGELKPGMTDFVNLPTPLYWRIQADDCRVKMGCDPIERSLNLHNGVLSLKYTICCENKRIQVREERFFSLANTGLLVQRVTLTPNESTDLETFCGVQTSCCNLPVPDDQMKESHQTAQLTEVCEKHFTEKKVTVKLVTKGTRIAINEEVTFHVSNGEYRHAFEDDQGTGLVFSGKASPEMPLVMESCAFISTSRDRDPRIQRPGSVWNFNALLKENEAAWERRWEFSNVEIEGDAKTDAAMRYAAFELIANDSAKDSSVSIGARGLTHTRYKGCYFWDTDLFMMPFYLYTAPEAAKNLMRYRTDTLAQAKQHARKMNGLGARYPWMAAYDGSEQCESWDIGASELHITADIVHALNHYVQATDDEAFYACEAAQVYIETARFWKSRYTPEPETGKVNLLFCKGPDEYCGITSNNLYTNMLVKENLKLARQAADYLYQHDRAAYQHLGITQKEAEGWDALNRSIKLPRDPVTGHWRQDDTFHLLEPVQLSDFKQGDAASYRRVCFDRLQRYRVIKQADVLLLMTRLPNQFTAEEKKNAWQDFEPLCLHDSTLSFATHALFASQNGLMDQAQSYFKKAAFLDLCDVMENTGKEGLHFASLGETWQALVLGFGGLSFQNGAPVLAPHLPASWKSMRFRFFYRGKQYEAEIEQGRSSLREVQCNDCKVS